MDFFFSSKREFIQVLCFWVWFCFALLGSSLTESQSTIAFVQHPSSQTVKVGSSVTLDCSAQYVRKITYEWELNNSTLQADTDPRLTIRRDGTLEISKVTLEDRGVYNCIASARKGKVVAKSNPATLTVEGMCDAVKMSIKPSGSKFLTGQDLQLRCKCVMSPMGQYAWIKDGAPLQLDQRVYVDRNKLNIQNATKTDSGNYSCSATSQDGATTKTAATGITFTVIVGKFPEFQTEPPHTQTVVKGSQVVIPCEAIGNPPPQIEWYADAAKDPLTNTSEQTIFPNGSLVLNSVDTNDATMYKCSASNMLGSKVAETRLKIAYLKDVVLKEKWYIILNDKTNIKCNPPGDPAPTVAWKREGEKDFSKRFGVSGCCTLQNNKTRLQDSGNYTCSASNMAGTKTKTVQIIVSVPPTITVRPVNQVVEENKPAVLNCSANSMPKQNVNWRKNGKPYNGDEERIISPEGIVIPKAKPEDSGSYQCYINHPGGWTDNAKANLTVMAAVKLGKATLNNVKANLRKQERLECDFVGHPPIKVVWTKEGVDKFPDRIRQDGNVLTIREVEKEDAGQYRCVGSNSFSSFESYVNLSVYMYPVFDLIPKNTTAYEKDSIWLHCNASGDPTPKISWGKEEQGGDRLDKERFIIHGNGTLNIKNVRIEDEGRYYCVAANRADLKQITISLKVQATPAVPAKAQSSMGRTIGIAVGCAAGYIVLVVGLMIYCKGRRARQSKKQEIDAPELPPKDDIEHLDGDGNDMTMNPVYGNQGNYNKMEFPRHDLEALRTLGNGAYGRAFLARASGIRDGEKETVVVVKALMSRDDLIREEFSKEMEALASLQHENVVALLGICKEEDPSYMIFESLEKGDLKQFLLSGHDNGRSALTSSQKLSVCAQVASGMNYLASQGFVHKDLASRNCMVGKDMEVKIGFLSMNYDLYSAEYYRFNSIMIPLRWMPPEAIFDDDYSEKSDVWAYGVLVWEVYSLGQLPYQDRSDEEVLKCIKDDLRLPKPDNCPDTVLEILEKCWEGNPLARPSFTELTDEISGVSVDSHV